MLAALVDDGRHGVSVDDVDATADEWEPRFGKVDDLWRDSELAVKPRLDRVAIARRNVERRRCQKRPLMSGYDLRDFAVLGDA